MDNKTVIYPSFELIVFRMSVERIKMTVDLLKDDMKVLNANCYIDKTILDSNRSLLSCLEDAISCLDGAIKGNPINNFATQEEHDAMLADIIDDEEPYQRDARLAMARRDDRD